MLTTAGAAALDGFGVRVHARGAVVATPAALHGRGARCVERVRAGAGAAAARRRAPRDELRPHHHGDERRGESDDRRGGDESQEFAGLVGST